MTQPYPADLAHSACDATHYVARPKHKAFRPSLITQTLLLKTTILLLNIIIHSLKEMVWKQQLYHLRFRFRWIAGLFIGYVLRWRHLVSACEVKGPRDRMLAKPWRRLFLAAYTLWAEPDCCCCAAWQSVCHCCPVWQTVVCCLIMCKVERFVFDITKRILLLVVVVDSL